MLPQAIGTAPRRAATAFSVGGGVSSYTVVLDGPLEAQEPLLALPRRAGHKLPTQLRIMIPGAGGRDRSRADRRLQHGRRSSRRACSRSVCSRSRRCARTEVRRWTRRWQRSGADAHKVAYRLQALGHGAQRHGGPAVASAASTRRTQVSRRAPVRGPGAVTTSGTARGGRATAPGGTRTGGGAVRNCTREMSRCQQNGARGRSASGAPPGPTGCCVPADGRRPHAGRLPRRDARDRRRRRAPPSPGVGDAPDAVRLVPGVRGWCPPSCGQWPGVRRRGRHGCRALCPAVPSQAPQREQ